MTPTLTQYIFVPKKPKMSPGKIASQVSKVAMMFSLPHVNQDKGNSLALKEWKEEHGMCTIVLQVKDQTELHNVMHYLQQEKILHMTYCDEGYTEVPAGTMTAIATGIIDKEKEGWRFSKYRLYK